MLNSIVSHQLSQSPGDGPESANGNGVSSRRKFISFTALSTVATLLGGLLGREQIEQAIQARSFDAWRTDANNQCRISPSVFADFLRSMGIPDNDIVHAMELYVNFRDALLVRSTHTKDPLMPSARRIDAAELRQPPHDNLDPVGELLSQGPGLALAAIQMRLHKEEGKPPIDLREQTMSPKTLLIMTAQACRDIGLSVELVVAGGKTESKPQRQLYLAQDPSSFRHAAMFRYRPGDAVPVYTERLDPEMQQQAFGTSITSNLDSAITRVPSDPARCTAMLQSIPPSQEAIPSPIPPHPSGEIPLGFPTCNGPFCSKFPPAQRP